MNIQSRAITVGLLGLGIIFHLNSRVDLVRSRSVVITPSLTSFEAPPSSLVSASGLNYTSLFADLIWINAITNSGELWLAGHKNKTVLQSGNIIADLDPLFRDNYAWTTSVYFRNLLTLTEDEMIAGTQFYNRAMIEFPADPSFPVDASLIFIGGGYYENSERRRRESIRAIEYLEHATLQPRPDPMAFGLLNWFRKRLAQIDGTKQRLSAETEERLRILLQLRSPAQIREVRYDLEFLKCEDACIAEAISRNEAQFEELREKDHFRTIPTDMWLILRSTP